jgi:hypothetical protein
MKPRPTLRPEAALTLFEVAVVVAVLVVLAAVLLPVLAATKRKSSRLGCTNNVKQIGLAYRIWEGDNGDIYPMGISVTNGGSREMAATGDVALTFLVMSNELSTPKILLCPNDPDPDRIYNTNNFFGLCNSNISYLVGVDATNEANPQLILSGDCNLEMGGRPVKSGLLSVRKGDPVAWQPPRHGTCGNLGLADGSVQSTTSSGLHDYLVPTGLATNRLAIP